MRAEIIQHASSVRPPKSLVARGGLARTFGGLAGFVAVTFLLGGSYILQDAFANPLSGGAVALLFAALMIALAAILLFFLFKAPKAHRTMTRKRSVRATAFDARLFVKPAPSAARGQSLRNNLAYQRFYVDHSCIRP